MQETPARHDRWPIIYPMYLGRDVSHLFFVFLRLTRLLL